MNEQEYLTGWKNGFIRGYYYLSNGLNLVGEFRNIGLAIFGLYITLKLTNPLMMGLMFFVAVIILIPTGWIVVHKVSKVREWLAVKYGSHFQIKNFDYVKAQYELLVDIDKSLKQMYKVKRVKKPKKK